MIINFQAMAAISTSCDSRDDSESNISHKELFLVEVLNQIYHIGSYNYIVFNSVFQQ